MVGFYYGIDIGPRATVVSIWPEGAKEPKTLSSVPGAEEYQIPTALAKKKGLNLWFVGREAKRKAKEGEAEEVPDLFSSAIENKTLLLDGTSYPARDLISIFLLHILQANGAVFRKETVERLIITGRDPGLPFSEAMTVAAGKLGVPGDRLSIIDQRESFIYFALSQEPSLFYHDVLLCECQGQKVYSFLLTHDVKKNPEPIHISEQEEEFKGPDRDREFKGMMDRVTEGKLISSVYLVGDGFDGGWLKSSLESLLDHRRVFIGKNLFSKGASYAGPVLSQKKDWPFLYIGNNELKIGLSIRVSDRNRETFFPLAEAGKSFFHAGRTCDVILEGSPEIELWVRSPYSRKTKVETVKLIGLPRRKDRTTRLRIEARPVSDKRVEVTIRDLGFGEISYGTDQTWTYTVEAKEDASWEN